MNSNLRWTIAVTAILGAIPGAVLGAAILFAAYLLHFGAVTSALTTEGDERHREAVAATQVTRTLLVRTVVPAAACVVTTCALVVWLRFRSRPQAVDISPTAIGVTTVGGALVTFWIVTTLRQVDLFFWLMPFSPLAGGLGGGFAGTFLRKGPLLRIGSIAGFIALLAFAYHLARKLAGI